MSGIGIGEVIACLRKQKGITQEALAKEVGVSTQAVSKWETGAAYPDIALLPFLADFFCVSIDEIFGRDKSKTAGYQISSFAERATEANPKGNAIEVFLDHCWDMQMDYLDPAHESTEAQRGKAKSNELHSSRIVLDTGFTNFRAGLGFVAVPDPQGGWASMVANSEAVVKLFSEIIAPGFLKTLAFLMKKHRSSFTRAAIRDACGLDEDQCNRVIDAFVEYRLVKQETVCFNEQQNEIYRFDPTRLPLLLVVILYANEFVNESRAYYGYAWNRSRAFA